MSAVNTLATGSAPYLVQGNTALRDGRLTVAANAYRLAVQADPDNALARQSLATVLTLLRDAEGAVEQLEAAALLAPENAQAQADLGTALADLGRDERALEHLRRAVELEPDLQKARFNLANTFARMGRPGEAESHYRRLLEVDPDDLTTRSRLGTILAQQGKLEQAIWELRRVAREEPENAEARLNLGIALAEAGDLEGAIAQHQEVLGLPADAATLARTHFNLATFHLRDSDKRQALEHYRGALEYDNRLAPAHLNVANLLAGGGRLAEALPHFARVRELQPDHPTARLGEATALIYLGRFGDARTVLEETVGGLPSDASAVHALARLLAAAPDTSLRDGRRALVLISRALETATLPRYVETQAMALAQVGRFEDAADRQRAVLAEARRRGRTADAERLARNLARYESDLSCCADPKDVYPAR
jgi:tetratricopeptide (TPR) repeat protein